MFTYIALGNQKLIIITYECHKKLKNESMERSMLNIRCILSEQDVNSLRQKN